MNDRMKGKMDIDIMQYLEPLKSNGTLSQEEFFKKASGRKDPDELEKKEMSEDIHYLVSRGIIEQHEASGPLPLRFSLSPKGDRIGQKIALDIAEEIRREQETQLKREREAFEYERQQRRANR